MNQHSLQTLLQTSILGDEDLISPYLAAPAQGSVQDRIDIYKDGYYLRLEEVLAQDYASLAELMGAEAFSSLCTNYIKAHPSQHFSLNHFGAALEAYLKNNAPYHQQAHLAEIAQFEWAEYIASISADAPILTASDLQTLPQAQWPHLQLHLHPSCQLLSMHYNSLQWIEAAREDGELPAIKLLTEAQDLIVWRQQLTSCYYPLDKLQSQLLQAMQTKADFTALCDLLSHSLPEDAVAQYLVTALYFWLDKSLFIKM